MIKFKYFFIIINSTIITALTVKTKVTTDIINFQQIITYFNLGIWLYYEVFSKSKI